ncbi:hypothetical protein [Polaromonas sp. YR568]|uniref:hypothetical protein n=1 Tax=Polaromonas sp. YR568 TaxID=1855301 RepID=UPI00398BFE53
MKQQKILLKGKRAIVFGGGLIAALILGACGRPESMAATRLVYLAPYMPCEKSEPEFGDPDCRVLRKRDAVVVLRMPKHFGGNVNLDAPRNLEGGLVLMPDRVLTTGEADYVEMEKKGYPAEFNPNGPISVVSFAAVWGWSSLNDIGHAAARRQMAAAVPGSGLYVEVKPYFEGFQTYDKQQCVDHFARFEKNLGRVSPSTTCDSGRHYLLPIGRPDVYVSCSRPEYRNEKPFAGLGCIAFSAIELRNVGGQSFYFRYSYFVAPDWLKDGHWKYIDRRLRDWIKSMDVTDQETSKGQK